MSDELKKEGPSGSVKSKFVVDKETASDEFDRFCEEWEIDDDVSCMSEDDQTGFESQKSKFISAVRRGRLSLNADGTLLYKFSNKSEKHKGESITIKRPLGSSYMEMDGFKDKQLIRKTYSVLASMTGKEIKYFSSIDGIDLKPLQAVITLFLAG